MRVRDPHLLVRDKHGPLKRARRPRDDGARVLGLKVHENALRQQQGGRGGVAARRRHRAPQRVNVAHVRADEAVAALARHVHAAVRLRGEDYAGRVPRGRAGRAGRRGRGRRRQKWRRRGRRPRRRRRGPCCNLPARAPPLPPSGAAAANTRRASAHACEHGGRAADERGLSRGDVGEVHLDPQRRRSAARGSLVRAVAKVRGVHACTAVLGECGWLGR
jgi:hypothetical protein